MFRDDSKIKISVDIIVNDRFKNEIYIPVVQQIRDNNINSELFVRSLKLIDTVDDKFRYTDILKSVEDDKISQ